MSNGLTLPFSGAAAVPTPQGGDSAALAITNVLGGIAVVGNSSGVQLPGQVLSIGVQGTSSAIGTPAPPGLPPAISIGVEGISGTGQGVHGQSTSGTGVHGESATGSGVFGFSATFHGVHGESAAPGSAGVVGIGKVPGGVGILGQGASFPPGIPPCNAGVFEGDVQVTGAIHVTETITCFDVSLIGGDCAEEFNLAEGEGVSPGTVMVIDNEDALQTCQEAYDRRVAGIVSGAGDRKPGITLDKRSSQSNRIPIALVGKVYCKADAQYGCINIGDLLTTSPTPGHAMKADDPFRAFGAVIGKALRSLPSGQGLIPVLVALQ